MEVVLLTDNTKPQNIINKYRISIIAALAFAVALCCIFAFAGNNSGESVVSSEADLSLLPSVEASSAIGEGIYIDGSFVAAVASVDEAKQALTEVLDARVTSLGIDPSAENSFSNNIEIISGEYDVDSFANAKKVAILLGKKNAFTVTSKVTDYQGSVLPVKLSVRSVVTYSEDVVIEHETKTIYTDAMRDGVKNVVAQGYDGEGVETYQVISVDGVVTAKEIVSLDVTVEPTDEVVRVGAGSNGIEIASLGTFIKPYDGIITSYFGPRWGRNHDGLDIWTNDCEGKPAFAAADGVVVRASEYGGYGNCVIIDHGDGVQTLYAHFSSISVEVGDIVSAGDEVGRIGNTGNSLGAHLHFEVRVDGGIVNPLIFVDYD